MLHKSNTINDNETTDSISLKISTSLLESLYPELFNEITNKLSCHNLACLQQSSHAMHDLIEQTKFGKETRKTQQSNFTKYRQFASNSAFFWNVESYTTINILSVMLFLSLTTNISRLDILLDFMIAACLGICMGIYFQREKGSIFIKADYHDHYKPLIYASNAIKLVAIAHIFFNCYQKNPGNLNDKDLESYYGYCMLKLSLPMLVNAYPSSDPNINLMLNDKTTFLNNWSLFNKKITEKNNTIRKNLLEIYPRPSI
jgi:hypothetical protein